MTKYPCHFVLVTVNCSDTCIGLSFRSPNALIETVQLYLNLCIALQSSVEELSNIAYSFQAKRLFMQRQFFDFGKGNREAPPMVVAYNLTDLPHMGAIV